MSTTDKPVYEWPREWYHFTNSTFRPQSRSETTSRPYVAGKTAYGPYAQAWTASLSFIPEKWNANGQAMAAFFSRLEGQAGLLRISDVMRRTAQLNRLTPATDEAFTDDTKYTDGTGLAVKPVPSVCTLAAPASRGDKFIVLGNLPVSYPKLLRAGDLVELRPRGQWSKLPSLHELMLVGSTDTQGRTGVEIRPRLSQNYAYGDMAVLDYAQGVFQLADDDQGAMSLSAPDFISMSFDLTQWVP